MKKRVNKPTPQCPECGTDLVQSSGREICPSCVLLGAVETSGDTGQSPSIASGEAPLEPDLDLEQLRFFGDYELLEKIGQGGMGVIFKARHHSLNREVALKLVPAAVLADPLARQRFHLEAESVASLQHPNIVSIYEIGERQGYPFYAMQLVDGPDLQKAQNEPDGAPALRQHLRDPRKIATLVSKIARAIQFAHNHGVLHRDLKPSNIILDSNGTPYITDFGLAKLLQSNADITLPGSVVGTPAFLAPEQVASDRDKERDTTAADVYGLGAILYATLAGHPPFPLGRRETSLAGLLTELRTKEPKRPSESNPSVPRDLETICLKAMRKEPQARYESAAALADDLDRWLGGIPISARPVRTPERILLWCRRQPVIAALVAVSAVSLLAGTIISSLLAARATKAKEDSDQSALLASQREAHANEISEFVKSLLKSSDPHERRGADFTVRQLLEDFESTFEGFPDQPQREIEYRQIIGEAYLALGLVDRAEPHLTKALALAQQEYTEGSQEVAEALLALASTRHDQGNYPGAMQLADQAYGFFDRQRGESDTKTLTALGTRIDLERHLGNHAKALELSTALQEAASAGAHQPSDGLAYALSSAAVVFQEFSMPDKAVQLLKRATEMASTGSLQQSHLPKLNLARALATAGRPEAALEAVDDVAADIRAIYGAESGPLLSFQAFQASLVAKAGDPEGHRTLQNLLEKARSTLGDSHGNTIDVATKFAGTPLSTEQRRYLVTYFENALKSLDPALTETPNSGTRPAPPKPDQIDQYLTVASALAGLQSFEDTALAEKIYAAALDRCTTWTSGATVFGDPRTLRIRGKLAKLKLLSHSRVDLSSAEAEALAKLSRKQFGTAHPTTFDFAITLAHTLAKLAGATGPAPDQELLARAKQTATTAITELRAARATDAFVRSSLSEVGTFFSAIREPGLAMDYCREALDLQLDQPTDNWDAIAAAYQSLRSLLVKNGDADSIAHYNRSMENARIGVPQWSDDGPETVVAHGSAWTKQTKSDQSDSPTTSTAIPGSDEPTKLPATLPSDATLLNTFAINNLASIKGALLRIDPRAPIEARINGSIVPLDIEPSHQRSLDSLNPGSSTYPHLAIPLKTELLVEGTNEIAIRSTAEEVPNFDLAVEVSRTHAMPRGSADAPQPGADETTRAVAARNGSGTVNGAGLITVEIIGEQGGRLFDNALRVQGNCLDHVTNVAFSPDGLHAYTSAHISGRVAVFDVEPTQGSIAYKGQIGPLRTVLTTAFTPDGDLAIATGYNGTVEFFRRDARSGLLRQIVTGSSSRSNHGAIDALFSPDGRFCYVQIVSGINIYSIGEAVEGTEPKIALVETFAPTVIAEPGSTPGSKPSWRYLYHDGRDLEQSVDGATIYAAFLESGHLCVFRRDEETGKLSLVQQLGKQESTNGTIDELMNLLLSSDGRHLYTNSGRFGKAGAQDDSIAHYDVATDGTLSLRTVLVPGDGLPPSYDGGNGLALNSDGTRLYATASLSDEIVGFHRDPTTGDLELIGSARVGLPLEPGAAGLSFMPTRPDELLVADEKANAIVHYRIASAAEIQAQAEGTRPAPAATSPTTNNDNNKQNKNDP